MEIVTILSSLATFVASLVALYIGVLRPHVTRPKLSLQLSDPFLPDLARVVIDDWIGLWIRLRVTNARRKRTAEKVEVILIDAVYRDNDQHEELPLVGGRTLKWANLDTNSIAIPPGTSRQIDVLELAYTDSATKSEGTLHARMALHPRSKSGRDNVPIAQIRCLVALVGHDIEAAFYRFDLHIDANWRGQEQSRAIKIKGLEQVSLPSGTGQRQNSNNVLNA